MITRFQSKAAANEAIAQALRSGRIDGGYPQVNFSATNYFTAHVRKGAMGWCL